ncbi:MAG TPA: stage V sporulation protein AC [Syntrophomonadaceae bacterium]|nr:stage V sporulation protein AC [Syntrophomonadaceae bacterium]
MNATDKLHKIEIEEYEQLVKTVKPKPAVFVHCIWAFVVGGFICVIAQYMVNYMIMAGMSKQDAFTSTSVIMIFLGALLTGLGIYDEIGAKAGAGSIVPITGFANSIVAAAMEFKREGYVFGVGARIFSVAGPTLLFGFVVSVLIGLIKVFMNS